MPRPLQAGGESVRIESCLRLKLRAAGRPASGCGRLRGNLRWRCIQAGIQL